MLTILLLAATPSPTPTTPNADLVTPGVWGFIITLCVGVATILLVWDMMRRVRRTRYRAEVNAKLDAEEAARAGGSDVEVSRPASGDGDVRRPDRGA
ncbi:hypothetical protein ACX9R5_09670 [Rathayibacter sp. CAU 1779]